MVQRNAPAVGTIEGGHRFKGGDPAEPSSWERLAPATGAEAAGFTDLGGGWFRGPDGGSYQQGRGGALVLRAEAPASSSGRAAEPSARTEDQGKSGGYARLMADAEDAYQDALDRGYDPGSFRNTVGAVLEGLPFGGLDGLGAFARDDVGDIGRQAELQWSDAQLKAVSGAAAPEAEIKRNVRTFFVRPGQNAESQGARTFDARANAFRAAQIRAQNAASDVEYYDANPAGEVGANGLPTYPGITERVAGIVEIPAPDGGYVAVDPNAPKPGDVRVTSQPLAPEDTPNSLSAQGYVYDAGTDTWRRSRTEQAPSPEDRGWTPESAVSQRRDMNPILRTVDAFGRGAADAVSLEGIDEISAALDSVFGQGRGDTVGERYRNNVEVQRAVDRADGEDVPWARNAGEIAGFGVAALGAAPRILASAGSRIASPVIRGAITGVRNALGGGLIAGTAAAGAEEGNALERAQAFLKAAPVGGVVGAVAPPVVSALARPVVGGAQSAARFLGRQVGGLGERAGVRGATALRERATLDPLTTAVDRFSSRMGPARVGQTADRIQTARDLGVDANLVTGLDDASIGRARALASRDTQGRDAVVDYATNAPRRLPSRVRSIANDEISPDSRPTLDIIDDLAGQRRNNAAAIQDFGNDAVDLSDNVVAAMRGNTTRTALRAAADRAGSSLDEAERLAEPMLRALAEGGPASARLTVREVQDISAALRKSADAAYRNGSPEGPILSQLGNAIRQAGRDQSEGYGAWLQQYADDSSLLEAATVGSNFVRAVDDPISGRSTDAFVRAASSATAPEQAVQRAASRRAIEAASSSPRRARNTLEAAASDEDFYRRADSLGLNADRIAARSRAEIDNVVRQQRASPRVGSESSVNLQDAAGAAGIDAEGIIQAARAPIRTALVETARRFQARGFSDAEAEALIRAAIDPARTDDLIAMLSQGGRMSRREARSLARAVQRSLASGQGSSSAAQ